MTDPITITITPIEALALAHWHTHPDRDSDMPASDSYAGHLARAEFLVESAYNALGRA